MKPIVPLFAAILLAIGLTTKAQTIVSITHGDAVVAKRSSNLIINGSFETGVETGATWSNLPLNYYWAPLYMGPNGGASGIRKASVPGWTAGGGGPVTYAMIPHNPSGPQALYATLGPVDGNHYAYFGNSTYGMLTGSTERATLNSQTGEITWPAGTNFTIGSANYGPQMNYLEQTINNLNPNERYMLDFWVTCEGSLQTSGYNGVDGFVRLGIGTQSVDLVVPSYGNSAGFGNSERYQVIFQPAATSVTIRFSNPGHLYYPRGQNATIYPFQLNSTAGHELTGEMALDDVILSIYETFRIAYTDFTVAKTNNETASLLTWNTYNEQDVAAYTIERSFNGTNFIALGTVASKGNSPHGFTYNYVDDKPVMGINYYRIKASSANGEIKYTDIKSLEFKAFNGISINPNPFVNDINLAFYSARDGKALFQLFSMGGSLLFEERLTISEGNNIIQLHLPTLPKAHYLSALYLDDKLIATKRLLKQ
jgi:hypothetical protein